jgi:hypothetical protein
MSTLQFNGTPGDYIEILDSADFSVATAGSLTVSAWMRPDVLTFPNSESTGYVHWMGKGGAGQQEWTFRMYNQTTTDVPPNVIPPDGLVAEYLLEQDVAPDTAGSARWPSRRRVVDNTLAGYRSPFLLSLRTPATG